VVRGSRFLSSESRAAIEARTIASHMAKAAGLQPVSASKQKQISGIE
jgi:hypothetical protein